MGPDQTQHRASCVEGTPNDEAPCPNGDHMLTAPQIRQERHRPHDKEQRTCHVDRCGRGQHLALDRSQVIVVEAVHEGCCRIHEGPSYEEQSAFELGREEVEVRSDGHVLDRTPVQHPVHLVSLVGPVEDGTDQEHERPNHVQAVLQHLPGVMAVLPQALPHRVDSEGHVEEAADNEQHAPQQEHSQRVREAGEEAAASDGEDDAADDVADLNGVGPCLLRDLGEADAGREADPL
mmetsp:Transcript_65361/g.181318  ORF Transcript_65361/g.181318 Transcript_65361/m.181318 type:complete len:235 (+) Transcript_65361:130-834(+)